MRRINTFAMLAVCAVVLAGCESGPMKLPAGATKLPPRELTLFFSDATVAGTSVTTGNPYEAYYAADGTVRLRSGPSFRDTGRYRISDGVMCVRFPLVRSGRDICATFFRDGSRLYRQEADGAVYEFNDTRVQGNPLGL